MRKTILLTLLLLLFSGGINNVYAKEITVFLDGKQIEFNSSPFVKNSTILVEFRPIFEALGLLVEWDGSTKTVIGKKEGIEVKLKIDNSIAYVNWDSKTLLTPPKVINKRTFVPLRFVSEASGAEVKWDGTNKIVNIMSSDSNSLVNNNNSAKTIFSNLPVPSENEKKATNKKDVYFKDNEVKLNDLKINITETKVIQPGETGNEYGEKPVFAIWYETTNLSDKNIDPTIAWLVVFEAVQDNNPNAVNTLEVGGLPDSQFRDSQSETIKKDGTVPNAIAYELDDLETPVTLIATQGSGGDKLGEQNFDIK